jgi:hypothetical protein
MYPHLEIDYLYGEFNQIVDGGKKHGRGNMYTCVIHAAVY